MLKMVGHLRIPEKLSGSAVEREEARVIRHHVKAVAANRDPTVDAGAGVTNHAGRPRAGVLPDLPTAAGVQGEHLIGSRHVHHARDDHGRGLQVTRVGGGKHPFQPHLRDVGRRDLPERRMTVATRLPVVTRPVARLEAIGNLARLHLRRRPAAHFHDRCHVVSQHRRKLAVEAQQLHVEVGFVLDQPFDVTTVARTQPDQTECPRLLRGGGNGTDVARDVADLLGRHRGRRHPAGRNTGANDALEVLERPPHRLARRDDVRPPLRPAAVVAMAHRAVHLKQTSRFGRWRLRFALLRVDVGMRGNRGREQHRGHHGESPKRPLMTRPFAMRGRVHEGKILTAPSSCLLRQVRGICAKCAASAPFVASGFSRKFASSGNFRLKAEAAGGRREVAVSELRKCTSSEAAHRF